MPYKTAEYRFYTTCSRYLTGVIRSVNVKCKTQSFKIHQNQRHHTSVLFKFTYLCLDSRLKGNCRGSGDGPSTASMCDGRDGFRKKVTQKQLRYFNLLYAYTVNDAKIQCTDDFCGPTIILQFFTKARRIAVKMKLYNNEVCKYNTSVQKFVTSCRLNASKLDWLDWIFKLLGICTDSRIQS